MRRTTSNNSLISTEKHRPIRPHTQRRHRKRRASTLLFSFASLELRLSEPAKPVAPTESGYPQGHRMQKNGHSAGPAGCIARGRDHFYPQTGDTYAHIIHKTIHRPEAHLDKPLSMPAPVVRHRVLGYNGVIVS